MEECQRSLESWNKQSFGHVGKQIAVLQNKIQTLESMNGIATNLESIHAMKMELNRWLGIEEEMWHQRGRNSWLKVGDKNTTFFHTKALNRYQRNTISRVLDSNNVWQEDADQIGLFVDYFEQLFSSSRPRARAD